MIKIENTFAEAFPMKCTRLIVTAHNKNWVKNAAESFCGFATSVIACGCEAGVEAYLSPKETPDGRPGVSILIFSMSSKELSKQILNRAGQCIMTSPTSAVFSGNDGTEKIPLGNALRYFGDGYQIAKVIDDKRYWRIPVMDGEFLCEDYAYQIKGIGGGNFLILGDTVENVLFAAEKAVKKMRKVKNIILPFPGGVVRSGSKVGSKYKNLIASTNFDYCPTLKGVTRSHLDKETGCVLEIVIDGINKKDIETAMRVGIQEVKTLSPHCGIRSISAGNYGGKLGPYIFKLKDII